MQQEETIMKSIIELIGNTPLAKIQHLNKNNNVELFSKLEGNNPGGSVKDRPALWMFNIAEEEGLIHKNSKIIEPTSGNTGIALAMIAGIKGYHIELVMPENSTIERVKAMRAYGAKITLTPADQSMMGAIDYAKQKVREEGFFSFNQFDNTNNPLSHYNTTGPEIWEDTKGKITHFVSAMGTTGTIMGVSRFLKEKTPHIKIIGVQPAEGDSIPGIRKWPKEYLPGFFERERVDEIITVSKDEAIAATRELSKKEGLFVGMSSGGAMVAALQIAQQISNGLIVTIACDRGDKYLSSNLFE